MYRLLSFCFTWQIFYVMPRKSIFCSQYNATSSLVFRFIIYIFRSIFLLSLLTILRKDVCLCLPFGNVMLYFPLHHFCTKWQRFQIGMHSEKERLVCVDFKSLWQHIINFQAINIKCTHRICKVRNLRIIFWSKCN